MGQSSVADIRSVLHAFEPNRAHDVVCSFQCILQGLARARGRKYPSASSKKSAFSILRRASVENMIIVVTNNYAECQSY